MSSVTRWQNSQCIAPGVLTHGLRIFSIEIAAGREKTKPCSGHENNVLYRAEYQRFEKARMPLMATAVRAVIVLVSGSSRGTQCPGQAAFTEVFNAMASTLLCLYLPVSWGSAFLMCHQNHPNPGIKKCREHFLSYYFCVE